MRPHTFAVLAVLTHYLKNQSSSKNFFTVSFEITKGDRKVDDRSFQVTVDDKSSNKWKLRVNRVSGTIKYYCELEILRPEVNKDKFIIRHNHAESIYETVIVYSGNLEGEYTSHPHYRGFKTYQTPEPHNLHIYSDYQDHRYRITNFY